VKTNPTRAAAALLVIASAALTAAGFSAPEEPAYSPNQVIRLSRDYAKKLEGAGAAQEIVRLVQSGKSDAETGMILTALGRAVHERKAYEAVLEAHARLAEGADLEGEIVAATLLFEVANALPVSPHGLTDEAKQMPEAVCEQAARMLGHPSPVIQAMGDWILGLRVKKWNSGVRVLDKMWIAERKDAAWHGAWKSRNPRLAQRDDYARQLVHMQEHLSIVGAGRAVEACARSMERMAEDPGSRTAVEAKAAFDQALASARAAVEAGGLGAAQEAYLALRQAGRGWLAAARADFPSEGFVFFTNPSVTGGIGNVNFPVTGATNPPVGDIFIKRSPVPQEMPQSVLGDKLGLGSVRGMDLSWEADRLLFSFWHAPMTGDPPYGWTLKNAHLYETDLEGREIRQLTKADGYNDIEPCFLPDGGYIFASDRSSFGNQCAGPILQNKRCTTLFRLDPRRGAEPVAISNNKDFDRHPHVLNDGTVVFLHWEYQERGLYSSHNTWRSRPDGTNMDAYYKQHISAPMSIRDMQQVPGSELHVATAQGHHEGHYGPVILANPSLGINNEKAMWLLTPGVAAVEGGLGPLEQQVVPQGGVRNRGGSYINPFPLSERSFLVGHDMAGGHSDYGIYLIDVWGNRELLHRDKDMSCFMPHPLRPRPRPPVVADMVKPEATFATAFVEDVYRDLPGVEKGAVKYLRLSQSLMLPAPVYSEGDQWKYNHLHYLPGDATTRHFGYWQWAPSRTIGLIKVAPDGSAFFKVPAGTPVYLQALDENYGELRRMRSSFTLQRGEFRSCTGCHESRLETVGNRKPLPKETLAAGPQDPVPPPWGDRTVLDYRRHIQPVFNAHCVSCHGEKDPEGGIDLTAREIGGFAQSYRTIFGLKPSDPTPVRELDWHAVLEPGAKDGKYPDKDTANKALIAMQANQWPGQLVSISDRQGDSSITQPLQFGSNKSRLIRILLDDPGHRALVKEKMSPDEWMALVTWVDYNAIYHGTLFDVRHYNRSKTFTRVDYELPSPWVPADLSPSFLNQDPASGAAAPTSAAER